MWVCAEVVNFVCWHVFVVFVVDKSGENNFGGAPKMQQNFFNDSMRAEISRAERRYSQKRIFDIAVTLALIAILMPLMIVIVLAIVIADGTPVFFGHERIGRNGRSFLCFKFRTMRRDADSQLEHLLATDADALEEWTLYRKLRSDPRILPGIGGFLRQTSLDELPQLFNVLRGEMSLVGPRPVTSEELELYGSAQAHYLSMRPGLTGAWQIGDRSDGDFVNRVDQDRAYVEGWTFQGDLAILLRTLVVPFSRRGAY